MQAAANRSAAPLDARSAAQDAPSSVRASANDHALLAALPIAAAIVGITSKGVLRLIERNARFDEVIALTGDTAMMSGDFRGCQHLQIAQLMQEFLADFQTSNELDFCEGEGI